MIPLPSITIAEMIRNPDLWAACPIKQARRLAKFRQMGPWRQIRAMELFIHLKQARKGEIDLTDATLLGIYVLSFIIYAQIVSGLWAAL